MREGTGDTDGSGKSFLIKAHQFENISGTIQGIPADSVVKNPPAMQEMWVRSLGGEDPLEKEMATHTSILARIISWTEEPGGLRFMGLQRVRQDLATKPCPPKRLKTL